ncbi:MAG: aminopeptidase [Proteobacteria bacterium]|nr:aminopeptidase [Pseudomonadota bacterium]
MTDKKPGKKEIEALQKKLSRKPVLCWDSFDKKETDAVFSYGERYKSFLDHAKTEREAVNTIREVAEQKGFKSLDTVSGKAVSKGRFYRVFKDKVIALCIIGKEPLSSALNLVASHMDSPRLDLKQNPLYEELDIAMIKTHYYGGIKKYQWFARPLSLHGSVITTSGRKIDLVIGESDTDPVFTVSDLLPHLASSQSSKKLSEAFEGEKMNLLAGSMPTGDDKIKERFKLTILKYLYDEYGIIEEDLVSSDIEVVPAGKARDVGLDKSMIGAYGQDDRICVFSALEAILNVKTPRKTAIVLFYDKEEIGSEGSTGAKSHFIDQLITELLMITGNDTSSQTVRKTLMNASALSGDVNAAVEPDYKDVHEKRNAPYLGYGICLTKFTGHRGKTGSSEASAEFMGAIRTLFNKNNIIWQTGELGKIDEGGGGTMAKYLASYGMDILDCGPAVLSMHAPFEISSKADAYMTGKAYQAFLES